MSAARIHSRLTYARMKAAFRRLADRAGGAESSASITRVSHSQITKYGLPHDPQFAPIDVVADLENDCGVAPVTRALADLSGHLLVPKPLVNARGEWVRSIGEVSREVGEAVAVVCTALADDGDVSAPEIKSANILGELREAEEALAALRVMVEHRLAEAERGEGAE